MNTISAIIPTFNRSSTLLRAIDSVLNQTFSCLEVIVVDDGSTDDTEKLLQSYIESKKIKYIKTVNRGVSAARNLAIEEAKGNWVSFLDSDDEWLPEKNQMQLSCFEKTKLPLIHGEEIWIRKGKRVNSKNKHKKFGGDIFEKCLPLCLISPSASMIKKSALKSIGLFNEDYLVCEDYDLWLRFTLKFQVGFVETPIIIKYGGHEDQLSMKYKAMDYYRVKSMRNILLTNQLDIKLEKKVKEEMSKKCSILLTGYQKHNNMSAYNEIEDWMKILE